MDLSMLSEEKQGRVNDFIGNLPTRAQLQALSETRQSEIAQENEWFLAYYVASMVRQRNFLTWIFETSP
jgi:hypothetical protein